MVPPLVLFPPYTTVQILGTTSDCMKVFVMESKKLGLDYTQELESWVRTMSIMGTN